MAQGEWGNAGGVRYLSDKYGIRVTGFPVKYSPVTGVHRKHIANKWKWRHLRGIQCILLATHGIVSPNSKFFNAAFGDSSDKFMEIISMPDRYIIYRDHYRKNGAYDAWRKEFRRLSPTRCNEFLDLLGYLNRDRKREQIIDRIKNKQFRRLLEHYYPGITFNKQIG